MITIGRAYWRCLAIILFRIVVDLRDRVIRRVTQEYNGVDNKRFFLIEAGSAKQA